MYSLCMYKASSTLTTVVAEICDYRQCDAVSADYIVAVSESETILASVDEDSQ